jgi:hypothetical protein
MDREAELSPACPAPSPIGRRVGALCLQQGGDGLVRVLLVTDEHGCWRAPTGEWPAGQEAPACALETAWRSAGVHGVLLGSGAGASGGAGDRYGLSGLVALRVESLARAWPEDHRRQRRWCTLREAREIVREPALAEALAGLAQARRAVAV